MQLSADRPTLDSYFERLAALVANPKTHFYLDTSFLIWLTSISGSARKNFIDWLEKSGMKRFHVPGWASHEYHRHHVLGTPVSNLTSAVSGLNKSLHTAYEKLTPAFYGGDLSEFEEARRIGIRKSFADVLRLNEEAKRWAADGQKQNSDEVIDLINKLSTNAGDFFGYFESIGGLQASRYSGRVPPGFQDKAKRDTEEIGGNRAGDLVFWKEILDHAGRLNRFRLKPINVIVITNDGKNDWTAGGGTTEAIKGDHILKPFQKTLDPCPEIHPTLAHEAKAVARVAELMLVNSVYLGAWFIRTKTARAFADAAVTIPLDNKQFSLAKHYLGQQANTVLASKESASTYEEPPTPPTPDTNAHLVQSAVLIPTATQLTGTFFENDKGQYILEATNALHQIVNAALSQQPTHAIVNQSFLATLSWPAQTWLGRRLYEHGLAGDTLAKARLTDLIASLSTLPLHVATAIYGGMLYAMYFDNDDSLRASLKTPFLASLLSHQTAAFAKNGIEGVSGLIEGSQQKLLYLPNPMATHVSCQLETSRIPNGKRLKSIVLNDVQILDKSCGIRELTIAAHVDTSVAVNTSDVISIACYVYGVPFELVDIESESNVNVEIVETDGFNDPREI